jgi:hypothetical protein
MAFGLSRKFLTPLASRALVPMAHTTPPYQPDHRKIGLATDNTDLCTGDAATLVRVDRGFRRATHRNLTSAHNL